MKHTVLKILIFSSITLVFGLSVFYLTDKTTASLLPGSINIIPVLASEISDGTKTVKVDIVATNITIAGFKSTTPFIYGRCGDNNESFSNWHVCTDLIFQENITDNFEIATIVLKVQNGAIGSINIKLNYIQDDGTEKVYQHIEQIGEQPFLNIEPSILIGLGLIASFLIIVVIVGKYCKRSRLKKIIPLIAFMFAIVSSVLFNANSFNTLPETGTFTLDKQTISDQISKEKGVSNITVEISDQRGTVSNISADGSLLANFKGSSSPLTTPNEIAANTLKEYQKYIASQYGQITFGQFDSQTTGDRTYTKFQQYVSGVPIFGGQVIVLVRGGVPKTIVATTSSIDYIDTIPLKTENEAAIIVFNSFKNKFGYEPEIIEDAKLWVYDASLIDNKSSYKTLMYGIEILDDTNPVTYFIDANNGSVISEGGVTMLTETPDIELILNITPFCNNGIRYEGFNFYNVNNIVDNYWVDVSTNSSFPSTNSYHKYFPNTSSGGGYIPTGFTKSTNNSVPMQNLLNSTVYYVRVLQIGSNLYSVTKSFTSPGTCPASTPTPTPTPIVSAEAPNLTLYTPFCESGKIYEDVEFTGNGANDDFHIDISTEDFSSSTNWYHQYFPYTQAGNARIPIDFDKALGGTPMGDLIPDTTYFVRVFQVGTNLFSEVKSFTTPACSVTEQPTITLYSTMCNSSTGQMNKVIGYAASSGASSSFWIDISTSSSFPVSTSAQSFHKYISTSTSGSTTSPTGFTGMGSDAVLTNYAPLTTYYVRAVQNNTGTYSAVKSFTTPACSVTDLPRITLGIPVCNTNSRPEVNVSFATASGQASEFYVALSTSPLFPTLSDASSYRKNIPSVITGSTTIPIGFRQVTTGDLLKYLLASTKYYVKVFEVRTGLYSTVKSFTTPTCSTVTPTPIKTRPTLFIGALACSNSNTVVVNLSYSLTNNTKGDVKIDISTSKYFPNFTFSNHYYKTISDTISGSTSAPSGFLQVVSQKPLNKLLLGKKYYVRVQDVTTGLYSITKAFTAPTCSSTKLNREIFTQATPTSLFESARKEGAPSTGIRMVDALYDQYGAFSDYLYNTFQFYGPNGYRGLSLLPTLSKNYANISINAKGSLDRSCLGQNYAGYNDYKHIHVCYPDADLKFSTPGHLTGHETTHSMTGKFLGISTRFIGNEADGIIEALSSIFPAYWERDWSDSWSAPETRYDASIDCSNPHSLGAVIEYMTKLFTMGGSQNECTVSAIGWTKAEQITFELYHYLTNTSKINDVYTGYNTACNTLIGSFGITADDCLQVKNAGQATMLDQPGKCVEGSDPTTPLCAIGGSASNTTDLISKTPISTPTVPEKVVCGLIDVNNDNILDAIDHNEFLKLYSKSCSDTPPKTGCGGMDTDGNGKIDISDAIYFSKNYFTVKSSCTRY